MINDRILSFGRRRGRALSQTQQQLMTNLLPKILISENCNNLFQDVKPIHMEIGFGNGQHLACIAKANPHINYIGCEPYLNGVGNLLALIDQYHLGNVKLWCDDARILLDNLSSQSLEKIYILFPDPWPKIRHHKRRIINPEMLELLANKLVTKGQIQIATDHAEYAEWILEQFSNCPRYIEQEKFYSNSEQKPENWVDTRYQLKAEKLGIASNYFKFAKIN